MKKRRSMRTCGPATPYESALVAGPTPCDSSAVTLSIVVTSSTVMRIRTRLFTRAIQRAWLLCKNLVKNDERHAALLTQAIADTKKDLHDFVRRAARSASITSDCRHEEGLARLRSCYTRRYGGHRKAL